jgi:hypothetical protein
VSVSWIKIQKVTYFDVFVPFYYDFTDTINDLIRPTILRGVCHLTNFLFEAVVGKAFQSLKSNSKVKIEKAQISIKNYC